MNYLKEAILNFIFKISCVNVANRNIIDDAFFLSLFKEIRRDGRAAQNFWELSNIYRFVQQTQKTKVDIAEVGVYRGGTARLISEVKEDRFLYLFDTFEEIPQKNKIDRHGLGDFGNTSFEDVKLYLKNRTNISITRGVFPESANAIKKQKIFLCTS